MTRLKATLAKTAIKLPSKHGSTREDRNTQHQSIRVQPFRLEIAVTYFTSREENTLLIAMYSNPTISNSLSSLLLLLPLHAPLLLLTGPSVLIHHQQLAPTVPVSNEWSPTLIESHALS